MVFTLRLKQNPSRHYVVKCAVYNVLISPQPDLIPRVFCLMVRIFPLMLVLLYIHTYIYIYIYIYSTNIRPIMIINRIYEIQNLLPLQLVSFQVGLRIYQHPCKCTRVGTLIVATIYLQLIQNRYMFRSFTVLQYSHQHFVQPVASDVEVVGYLQQRLLC